MNSKFKRWSMVYGLWSMALCGLLTMGDGLVYGQDDHLTVKGNTNADSVIFSGDKTAYPTAPLEGEIFYNSGEKLLKYFDGTTWIGLGGGGGRGKTVASKIVAALNTPDGTSRADSGYVCDGTDDQQEINKAINSLPAAGGAVYLLEGTYNISAALLEGEAWSGIVPHSNTAIIGTGKSTVLKIVSDASDFNVISGASVNRILISQLMIDGNSQTGSGNRGIYFSSVTYSKIDKVWVENVDQHGISLYSSSNNTISNSNAQGNSIKGIYLSSSSNNVISGNNMQGNSGEGIHLSSSSNNNIISNNNVQGNNTQGTYLSSSSNNVISANVIYDNGGSSAYDGIKLDSDSDTNIISSNRIYDSAPATGGGYGIDITASTCNNNYFVANLIDGAGYIDSAIPPTYDRRIRDVSISPNGTRYTDKAKLTFEPGSYTGLGLSQTLTPTGASSYLRLYPTEYTLLSGTAPIAAGKAAGDILILEGTYENPPTITIIIANVGAKLNTSVGSRTIGTNDILTLIWDGSVWVEVEFNDN